MIIQLTPAIYTALRGLVQDALEHPSDATPLLERAADELAHLPGDESTATAST